MAMGATKKMASQNIGTDAIAANGFFWLFQSCSAPATGYAARTRVKASSYFG
jgi:hypothetical protein